MTLLQKHPSLSKTTNRRFQSTSMCPKLSKGNIAMHCQPSDGRFLLFTLAHVQTRELWGAEVTEKRFYNINITQITDGIKTTCIQAYTDVFVCLKLFSKFVSNKTTWTIF